MNDLGFGYTLGTGRLYMSFSEFQLRAEQLLGRPILTHEFGDKDIWVELRREMENQLLAKHSRPRGRRNKTNVR